MNTSRLLLLPIAVSLVSCGSDCIVRNNHLTKSQITNETNEKSIFYEQELTKNFGGIESIKIIDSKLSLNVINKGFFYEYNAPIVKVADVFHYPAQPVFGGLLSLASVGLWPLFAPRDFYVFTFGCTSTSSFKSEIDKTRKIKTGKIEWRNFYQPHKISISGFDKEYTFNIENNFSNIFDITEPILNTELTNSTSLKITCLDCSLKNITELNSANDIKTSIQLNYDFRPIKSSLIEAKRKAMELQQTEKSNLKTTESTNISEHTLDPAIEKAKETCLSLGFKNEKLGNCVLKLTK